MAPAQSLETAVRANIAQNEEGWLRVRSLDIQVGLDVGEKDRPRVNRCLEIFENYCTVTQSVRKGIEVNVNVT